jgi:hypothetical protein
VSVAPDSGPVKLVSESSYLVYVNGFVCVYEVMSSESALHRHRISVVWACPWDDLALPISEGYIHRQGSGMVAVPVRVLASAAHVPN